jgi:hypothetical protein
LTADHETVTERGGGGRVASPSPAKSRRTAWGSVTAPTIRRGPAQRGQTRTSIANRRVRPGARFRAGSMFASDPLALVVLG